MAVGLPFFAVSATSPVLQAWFAATGHPAARDPYVLYAASNLGSMLALLAYPLIVERFLRLDAQSRLWAWGYGVLLALAAGCALALWRRGASGRATEPARRPTGRLSPHPARRRETTGRSPRHAAPGGSSSRRSRPA